MEPCARSSTDRATGFYPVFIFTGHPFTVWHKNNWRNSENYWLGQHIGLDFDTEDERSTLAHLRADKFVARYASLIYTTPTHKPDKPRARVLFTLDTPIHQAVNYTLAASAMLWLFGAADPKAKDAARFFYGSVDCEVEWIDSVLPLAVVRDLIQRYQATGRQAKRDHDTPANRPGNVMALVQTCIDKARDGERNNLGFWLACRLAEEGLSQFEAEAHMRMYQQSVTSAVSPYTEAEARASLLSAYRKVN